ncbi:hypothetical protein GlitD10_0480 [Gloeomargarita lithophora Alchichica-D10]|uniref:Phycobilisome protein n=1 Tax=Gloeomargarita lithophora Alchichica-D10 TaxID=1188229 RepID=A0A1J0AA24_9CYAN|nr:hypothetical protein [Gloeomargarita lithophora]APB32792.1 hypothetical protein GlitD10_0480 [Gloeomargarita lithophora Alchichica-D10]
MNPMMLTTLNTAEQRYLEQSEQQQLWQSFQGMTSRLAVYEQLRTQEAQIFRPVARQIPASDQTPVMAALCDWVGALRGAALAMVLDDPELFNQRVGQWLQARPASPLHPTLGQLLQAQLKTVLGAQGWPLLAPFWEQAHRCLCNPRVAEARR